MLTLTGDDDLLSGKVTVIVRLCVWAFLFAAYLMFAGEASADEVVAGVVCASAAVLWWVGVRRASTHTFAFDFGSWAAAGRAWRQLPRATLSVAAILVRALVRRKAGKVERRFYAHGRTTDPADSGRRAIGVLAASLAPDSFILRTPMDRDEIIVHGLPGAKPSTDPRWPI